LEAGPMPAGTRQTDVTELGGLNLVDALNAPLVAARPKPRGLLAVPPEVEAVVAGEEARPPEKHGIPLVGEARQRLVDSLTLQYHYGASTWPIAGHPRGWNCWRSDPTRSAGSCAA
jgi:hypothetical protein